MAVDILEVFAEAQRRARPEYLPSGFRIIRSRAKKDRRTFVALAGGGGQSADGYVIRPPLAVVETCPLCGGRLERRPGCARPTHIGRCE